jgi:TRAP-type mannitol/chloroaromatic compound transport system substrate-binding protein
MKNLTPLTKFLAVLAAVFIVFLGGRFLFKGGQTASVLPTSSVKWKIATAWSKECLIMQEEIQSLAKDITERSKGALTIEFVTPQKGKLTDLFDAVSANEIQMLHGSANYWKEKMPASVFFASFPFGMNHDESEKWLTTEGLALWQNLYAPYNVIPFPCGHSGYQMGGWYNREITEMDDFKDLWIRMSGLGGLVLEKHGARIKLCAASEIYAFLNEDKLNRAAQFIGPYDDFNLGLHQIGTYYYEGWQGPNTAFELTINKTAYSELSPDIQEIIKYTVEKYNERIYRKYTELNAQYKKKMIAKGVQIKTFSPDIKRQLLRTTRGVLEEYINNDASGNCRAIYESYKKIKDI